jgi:hypothetical protein
MSKQKIIEAVEKLSEKDLEKFSKILNDQNQPEGHTQSVMDEAALQDELND